MNRCLIVIELFLVFIFHQATAQPELLSFKHLNINDGLSQSTINCMLQDKNGFMWFGTQDGLNRYDGFEFVTYRNKHGDPNSISNNYITDIYEDGAGVLWIATFGGGLNSLNPLNGKVYRYKTKDGDSTSFPSDRLFSLTEYPAGTLWIGSNEGLIKFDKSTGRSQLLLSQKISSQAYSYHYIGKVTPDEMGSLWLRSDSGLTRIDARTHDVMHFRKGPFSGSCQLGEVYDILLKGASLLVACEAGFVEIDLQQKTDTLLLSSHDVDSNYPPPIFRMIIPLPQHQYAIGTNAGLIIYNSKTKQSVTYKSNPADTYSLTHNYTLSLFRSSDGVLWVGTRNGLNKLENEDPDIIHFRKIVGKFELSNNNVNSFIEENDSLLWISTTEGINLYNKNSGLVKPFKKNGNLNNSLTSDYMLCLYKDSKGNKWLGTRNGGFYKIVNRGMDDVKFIRINPDNADASLISVHFITEADEGFLWIGTGGAGLWRYNTADNTVKQYFTAKDGTGPNHPYVFTILKDSYENIWLGTPIGGLNLFNPETESFIYFQHEADNENSLSNDIVLSLHEDEQHHLWIGTSGGLNKLIPKLSADIFHKLNTSSTSGNDSLFVNFGYDQGFPNDVIYGMLEDRQRKLWLSTNKGLIVFDMDLQKLDRALNVSDGLQSNEFNQNSYHTGNKGWFYFGGVNGFNMFHPEKMSENSFVPPVVLTDLSLFNQPVKFCGPDTKNKFCLDQDIQYLDELRLSYKHNFITLKFAALSFISPEKNQYSYMLEGLNKDWIKADHIRMATFTHLPAGNYIFKLKASNNNGVWSDEIKALKIHISSPPWLSWYAYLLYFIIITGIVYLFLRFRINRATRELKIQAQIEKARSQERETFRKKSAADFHDEAGNKITKISLFTEMARNETHDNPQLDSYLEKIQANIAELSAGMRDFLWVLDPQQDSLFETISRLKDYGDSSLSDMGVRFTMSGISADLRKITLPMNTRRDILQIFKEAINNCAKYAGAEQVVLTIQVIDDSMMISLTDNGKGFDTTRADLKNKYGLSIMRQRAKKIDAELEINSQINKGTIVTLKCNIPHMGNSE